MAFRPDPARAFAGAVPAGSVFPTAALAGAVLAGAALAGPLPPADPARRDLLPTSPSVAGGALGGFVNPASWATSGDSDLAFWWNDRSFQPDALDNWGLGLGGPVGFSVERRTFPRPGGGRLRVYDYQVGFSSGDRRTHFGAAWRWSAGDGEALARESGLVFGTVARPSRFLTHGMSTFLSAESRRRTLLTDVGLRPLGRPWVTLFADWFLTSEQRPDEGTWSGGIEVRPCRGIHLGVRLREEDGTGDLEYLLNLGLTVGGLGLHTLPALDENGETGTTTYLVRADPPYRGLPLGELVAGWRKADRYEVVDLENRTLTYQRARWFDDGHVAWIDLARRLRRIRTDPRVAGIALHLSGARIRPSVIWELRRELELCREAGKRIALHFDRLGMAGYYLASVADRISLDPAGTVEIAGLARYRTYMKGMLDKLGIGFEELRYFPYKTAYQTLARGHMSDEDREQYGRMVDVVYETFRDGVCRARGLTPGQFDAIVDGMAILQPQEALEAGLVDETGRWDDLRDSLREEGFTLTTRIGPDPPRFPDERWGRPPTIGLVYAQGFCEMDSGIRGRATSAHLRSLAKRGDVAAVVLRADSPGGDVLPSDLVADGLRRIREEEKPVVVSQGDVAASGGYWISMDSDHVFTTPLTVTGSIGVIAGWAWDQGVGERTGLAADGVQRGAHADLFTGIRFPWIGVRLPYRPLAEDERARARELVLDMYGEFVGRVASARSLPEERVREIAQGRVWMGTDAVARGLCDETGTLPDAIDKAVELLGLGPGDEYRLEEYPPRRLLRLPEVFPRLPWLGSRPGEVGGEEESLDYVREYVRGIARRPGEPMLLVPPEALLAGWTDW